MIELWLFWAFVLVAMWIAWLQYSCLRLARGLKRIEDEKHKLYVELKKFKHDTNKR